MLILLKVLKSFNSITAKLVIASFFLKCQPVREILKCYVKMCVTYVGRTLL